MYCFFCGKENKDDQKFCKYCGKGLHPGNNAPTQVTEKHAQIPISVPAPVSITESEPEKRPVSNKLLIAVIVLLSLVLIALSVCLLIYIRSGDINPFSSLDKSQKETADISEKEEGTKAVEEIKDKAAKIEDEKSEDLEKTEDMVDSETDDTDSDMQEAVTEEKEEDEAADEERYDESADKNNNRIKIAYAEASSVLNATSKDHATYIAGNLFDGNLKTAWVEGVDGNGEGQVLVLHLDGVHKISGIKIYNGYLKTKRRYAINGRVTSAMIDYGNGNVEVVDLNIMNPPEEEVDFAPDRMGETEIKPAGEYETDTIIITILSAVPGSKYQDTAISEIEVFGE